MLVVEYTDVVVPPKIFDCVELFAVGFVVAIGPAPLNRKKSVFCKIYFERYLNLVSARTVLWSSDGVQIWYPHATQTFHCFVW